MSTFPYDGKSNLTASADPTVTELQKAHSRVEDMLLAMGRLDPDVKLIAHLDRSTTGHRGQVGTVTGPVRYWTGRFPNSQGLLIEDAGQNLVPNPSAEVNTTGFTALDGAVSLARSTAFAYSGNGVVSNASFQLTGTGDAGAAGITSGSLAVTADQSYSASVYVYSAKAAKAKLELSFTGGAAVAYDSGEVSLPAGEWTRLELLDKEADTNTAVELRLYLVEEAPAFAEGSLFSKRTHGDTAVVTDGALVLAAGDVVMCAVTANPSGPQQYSFHMVTTGATGVSSSSLRLDDQAAAPTFVAGTRLSKFAASMTSALASDTGMTLTAGDLVFCQLAGRSYDWHVVTTGATGVSSNALRLDGAPAAPEFEDESRLSKVSPTATALESGSLTIDSGDLLFCFPTEDPVVGGYGWHIATTGATVTSPGDPSLRLDGRDAAPTFAAASRVSKISPDATDLVDNVSMTLVAGNLAFCYPTANPAEGGYGWHMVTTGATGVSSSSLRLDQATSGVLYADGFQLEEGGQASGYIDSYQGTGFTGSLGSAVSRASGKLSYPTSGIMSASAGTVAFWAYPLWAGNDGEEHVLFDMAVSASQNRMRLSKDVDDKLVLSVYDGDNELKQIISNDAMAFAAKTWQHFAFTWSGGTLTLHQDGAALTTSTVGGGSGQLSDLPAAFFVGSDFEGNVRGSVVIDDLVVKCAAASSGQIDAMSMSNVAYLGMAPALTGFAVGSGEGTTDATPGTQVAIAHGLGVSPSCIILTPTSNGVVYLSADPDETNFYVKGSAASLDFFWRAFA